jgi:hypothetical protein
MNVVVDHRAVRLARFNSRMQMCPVGAVMFSEQRWWGIARSLKFAGRELLIVCGAFDDQKESATAANHDLSPRTVHTHFVRPNRELAVTDQVRMLIWVRL